ncbi:hypothetical protein TIFTF001_026425 [Ficus carica]|uniref:DUF674 domain-containing protein n=1 Tax=Ficus carica TaxID=3494 RepID=A0AA88DL49_FICCA|nr:hypothetical protein TIFTF001_026425 [Ficus carica]
MATSSSKPNITLKLLIDSKGQRVLFAEAGKDFADFLFTLLSLPLGTIIRLLSTNIGMVGSIGKLYESFENLSDTYIQPNVDKDTLLNPKSPIIGGSSTLLSLTNDASMSKRIFICSWPSSNSYGRKTKCSRRHASGDTGATCPNCNRRHASDDTGATCPNCNRRISVEVPYVAPPAARVGSVGEGGFVKGYMIMDDLEVKTMSTISSISMLNKLNVKEVGALEERTVSLGINEGLKLLKASLLTKLSSRVFSLTSRGSL